MSTYLIGDIHGCLFELQALLAKVEFNPLIDKLWITGDLVSRGPNSLEVLRLIYNLGDSVRIVLGNHDLHLLSVYNGISRNNPKDNITSILEAPDVNKLINWLRYQPIMQIDKKKKLLMVHAGITPQWDLATAIKCAKELEIMLKNDNYPVFIKAIYNTNKLRKWNSNLSNIERLRFIVNVFTKIRYCFPDGQLEMNYKDSPEKVPVPLKPWFILLKTIPKYYSIFFGHWASLMGQGTPENIYGIDTGCCWGGKLTLFSWEEKVFVRVNSTVNKN